MAEQSETDAAGPWWIHAKLRSDKDPNMHHSKDKLPEMIQLWNLMRVEYGEPALQVEILIEDEHDPLGQFMLTGESEHPVDVTRSAVRQLSALFAEIFELDSVEYYVADERLSIGRITGSA